MREAAMGDAAWMTIVSIMALGAGLWFVLQVVQGYRAAALEPSRCGRCGRRGPGQFCSRCGYRKF
jgi:hypothetical protein